jgi:predicted transcriptional regulator of viral defense system
MRPLPAVRTGRPCCGRSFSGPARSALSFYTAAELYGLVAEPGDLIHVTVPRNQRIRPISGAVIHYSEHLDQSRHPALLPPRTRIEDTVLDLAQVAPSFDDAFDWLCRAVGRRLTTPGQLRAACRLGLEPRGARS